ncbi:MAG: DUF899 family protein [Ignavibacteriae bacterium]|nr:DUF899 family protein [Ignavibacteriota bacterium]MCB9215300.1 DUF899 family protein [Ignavibacteria bacterium]
MTDETRSRLEVLENEISSKMEERRTLLKETAGETVQNYSLKNQDGSETTLSQLFGEKSELIVIHNMGKNCPYCTLWADGFNGVSQHLSDRAAFVVVSPNSPEVQQEFAQSRGWKFPMASAEGSEFTRDMGYQTEQDGKTYYMPGVSVFTRGEDGTITRVAYDFFGPGDVYAGIWHMFELLPNGPGDWFPRFSYN